MMELVIKRCMERQDDWYEMLNSVLLGMRSQVHSSTGQSPIRMLYNKDPLLPFQLAHKPKTDQNCSGSDNDECSNVNNNGSNVCTEDIVNVVEAIEEQRHTIFGKAKTNIKKAQQHQAKGYNNHQSQGTPFDVGQKVLKLNFSKNHLEKMKCHYVRPYEIFSRFDNGLYILKDKYSHSLKKPISESHLLQFYENKIYKVDLSTPLSPQNLEAIPSTSCGKQESEISFDFDGSCKYTDVYQGTCNESVPMTSTPIKLQIVNMSSKDKAFSSNKSEMLNVGTEPMNFLLGNVNKDDIEIEIVEDLNDNHLPIHFWPLGEVDRKVAAMTFSLVINSKTYPVRQSGFGEIISKPPPISIRAHDNGACLFNSFSILLSGRDMYSAIIRHVISIYIENPVKFTVLQLYIPQAFIAGKNYIAAKNMRIFSTWGTEVEIIAFAQISGFDVIVFTQQQQFATYRHDRTEFSDCKFYLGNESECHFDPILDARF